MLSIFDDVGEFCIAAATGARLCKADLHIVVAVSVHLYRG